MEYEFLTEKQNEALSKYFQGEKLNSTERYHMKRVREKCKDIIRYKGQAEELLIKL